MDAPLAALLLAQTLLWTWAGVASNTNFDPPGDMVEAYVWGQAWQWGYFKHPPLSAWVAGLWFAAVPESPLGYALLASLNAAIGLAGLAALAREFLPRPWVWLVVALTMLLPGFTTLAGRFNANSVLLSCWPWALALSVRLLQRGGLGNGLACGVACALTVLGKYYSGVLLVAIVAAACIAPAWRARLVTAPALLAVVAFVLCLAPHVAWLLAQSHGPLQYAQAAAGQDDLAGSMLRAVKFALAHVAFAAIAWLLLARALVAPSRGRGLWAAITAPMRPAADPVWVLAAGPILLTMLATVVVGARTAWVWGLPIGAALALLGALRAQAAGAMPDVAALWRSLTLIGVVIAVAAPLWWWREAAHEAPAVAEPREELAQAVDALWRGQSGRPLPWVSGTRALAASVAFYAASHPRYWSVWAPEIETPWVDLADLRRRGGIIVCDGGDPACERLARNWSGDRQTLRVRKSARGHDFAPRDYAVYRIEPQPERSPQ